MQYEEKCQHQFRTLLVWVVELHNTIHDAISNQSFKQNFKSRVILNTAICYKRTLPGSMLPSWGILQ
jgi:hypothetical protein